MFLRRNGIERILLNGIRYTYTRWVIFGVLIEYDSDMQKGWLKAA